MRRVILRPDELIAHCRQSLANYKIPRHVDFSATELPKSGSGKILKRILAALLGSSRTSRELTSMDPDLSNPAFWSRFQFGFTLTYHYHFPQLTLHSGKVLW
jgi:hypothetical protein